MKKPATFIAAAIVALLIGHRFVSNATSDVVLTPQPSPLLLEAQTEPLFSLYAAGKQENVPLAESILQLAHSYLGTAYRLGGNKPSGFDCSGFTHYVYSQFGLNVPHGSVNQAEVGYQIKEKEARKGDLLIFTGTNLSVREPGHVGIVISEKGEPIKFIHSSSVGGVKISEVPNTRYSERLLQIRRVI